MQQSESAEAAGTLGPGAVRALKIVVVTMGVMIFVGLALVAYRIVQLSGQKPTHKPGLPVSSSQTLAETSVVRVPAGAAIKSVTLSGHHLVIHYDAPAGGEILIMDAASGQTVSRVKIVPEAPAR